MDQEKKIEYLKITIDDNAHNERIGKFLSKNYRHVFQSRVKLHRAFKRNEITINGDVVEETRVLQKGDIVEVKYDNSIEETSKMQNIPIRICYEDNDLAIVWKPSGQNFRIFEKAIEFNTALKDSYGNRQNIWCIYDIQKAASGLILVAKTEEARDTLLHKYQNNEIQLTMRLLCHGFIQSTDPTILFTSESRGNEEQVETVVPQDMFRSMSIVTQTPSNNAQYITRLDLDLNTPFSSAKLKQLFMFQSEHPIVGNSKHTRPLKVNDKGLCAALTSIAFTFRDKFIQVKEEEPAKFGVLCDREARFHQLKLQKEAEEMQQAGRADMEGSLLLAYKLGQKQFCGHTFKVTQDCLIPRPSSESLVRAAIDVLDGIDTPRVIDVGTGCGNLLISILIQVASATGVGIDISDAALEVARENGKSLISDHQTRVVWRNQDMSTLDGAETFDVLVCNPPYLDIKKVGKRRDYQALVEQEPSEALFAEEEGYQWYRVLHDLAKVIVKENGAVVLECGKGMTNNVRRIWSDWREGGVYKDPQGWDRCLVFRK